MVDHSACINTSILCPTVAASHPPNRKTGAERRAALVALAGSYLGTALSVIKGIFFVPFYLKLFGVDVYGAWLATGNVVGLLGLADAGLTAVAYQKLAAAWGAGERQRFSALAAGSMALIAGVGVVIAAAGAALSPWVPKLVHAPAQTWHTLSIAFVLAATGAATTVVASCMIAIPTSWQRAEIGAFSRVSGQLLETLTIGAGMALNWGVVSLGIGSIVGGVLSLAICGFWTMASGETSGSNRRGSAGASCRS